MAGCTEDWTRLRTPDRVDCRGHDAHPRRPQPGPWAGEVRRLVAGAEVETLLVLEAHDDPIAQHHTLGGRKISALDPSLLGLPVLPFAVMAEMTAQVAALVVDPGLVLTGLKAVRAHKWVRYEEQPVYLELRGHRRVPSTDDDRVWVGIFNRGTDGEAEAPRPVFEAVAVFGESVPGRAAGRCLVAGECPSQQVHGPVGLRRAVAIPWPALPGHRPHGQTFRKRDRGTLASASRSSRWSRAGKDHAFHTDLVVIDNFTQLLGAWGLDYLAEGDVMFPLHMEDLEIHGGRPPVGTEVACQITIHELGAAPHSRRGPVRPARRDGVDADQGLGRLAVPLAGPVSAIRSASLETTWSARSCRSDAAHDPPAGAKAVWLEPPADMGRPVWRDVLEFTQLGPEERADLPG